jgi:AhpD family alkylhydroperoxidase
MRNDLSDEDDTPTMTTAEQSSPGDVGEFRKTAFSPRSLLVGTGRFVRNLPAIFAARRADRVSTQFVEKIMLATTAVTECRYCTRFHTEVARGAGVEDAVIDDILAQDVGAAVDATERPALLFAQRYAETQAEPGEEAVAALVDAYGEATAADIQAYVRAIYFANLLGNSVDAVLFAVRDAVRGVLPD